MFGSGTVVSAYLYAKHAYKPSKVHCWSIHCSIQYIVGTNPLPLTVIHAVCRIILLTFNDETTVDRLSMLTVSVADYVL